MADVSFNTVPSNKNVASFFHPAKSGIMNILSHNSHASNHQNIEKKSLDSTLKLLDKCRKLYQNSKLNLKNSPPFLIGTLNDIHVLLSNVILSYKDKNDELLNILYFKIMLLTVIDKSEQLIRIFKDGKDRIFDLSSPYRKKLTKLSLIFSHLYKTFFEFFQKGVYNNEIFRITKLDAASWWKIHFNENTIVPWKKFYESLSHTYKISDVNQSLALQNTINLCCNNYVTIYEFDVFVRLFQPWNNILETWKALAVLHPGYMSFMTYDDVRVVLMNFIDIPGPGTYVFRSSCTKLGQWAIGYITDEKQILQTIIQNKSLARALLDGEREGYYKYPSGSTTHNGYQDLYSLVHNLTQTHIQVSHEQYKVYCEMDSTFELCKICSENDKNIQLEPCQHLLCKPCLLAWQSSNAQTCPFCRLEIKSVEEIVVRPYNTRTELIDLWSTTPPPPLPPRSQLLASNASSNSDEVSSVATDMALSVELNYATLDFQSGATLTELCKSTQADLCPLVCRDRDGGKMHSSTGGSTAADPHIDTRIADPHANTHIPDTHTPDTHANMQILMERDLVDEKVAKLVLSITDNDIDKSRAILKYFKIKDDIIF